MKQASIWVGNLQWSTTEEELVNHFSPCGQVFSVYLDKDRDTGKPLGYAFVTMEAFDAERALDQLHGKELRGRPLKLNPARQRDSAQR